MDLEKALDPIVQHGLWQMLRMYGVGGFLLKQCRIFIKIVN